MFLGPLPGLARFLAKPGPLDSRTPASQASNPMAPSQSAAKNEPAAGTDDSDPGLNSELTPLTPEESTQPSKSADSTAAHSEAAQAPAPSPAEEQSAGSMMERFRSWAQLHRTWLIVIWALSIGAFLYGLWRWLRKSQAKTLTSPDAEGTPLLADASWPDYVKALRALSSEWGIPPAPGHTVAEIQRSWQQAGYPSGELDSLVTYHYQVTCNDQPPEPPAESAFRRLLHQLRQKPQRSTRL
jgi:hypothetical protein